jgi:hypothetical protein
MYIHVCVMGGQHAECATSSRFVHSQIRPKVKRHHPIKTVVNMTDRTHVIGPQNPINLQYKSISNSSSYTINKK